MTRLRAIIGLSVLALLAGAAAEPLHVPACRGDVNGDLEANVLDIQIVAAALLSGTTDVAHADVNGDGRVDILDFQALMARTSRPAPEPTPIPSDAAQAMIAAPREPCRIAQGDFRKLYAVEEAETILRPADRADNVSYIAHTPRTERYLAGSSPHSPPLSV